MPEPVFELLRSALQLCPNLQLVILEQLGEALRTEPQAAQFRSDFLTIRNIVETRVSTRAASFASTSRPASQIDADGWSSATVPELLSLQSALLRVLHGAQHAAQVRHQLRDQAAFAAQVDDMDDSALGIAARVVKRWARSPASS